MVQIQKQELWLLVDEKQEEGKYAKGSSQLLSTVQAPVFACNASVTTNFGLVGFIANYRVLSYFYFMVKNQFQGVHVHMIF
jgi:hypothetical protein